MPKLSSSINHLQEAAKALREVISATANEAMPQDLVHVVGWLNDVQRIVSEAQEMAGRNARFSGSKTGTARVAQSVDVGPATVRRPRKNEYPHFCRDGESLVKIGWSKKSRAPYEHKAPKAALVALTSALGEAGKGRRRFVVEDLLPLKSENGTEIPDYQAYVCLAWVRAAGLVQQHGRKGYTLSSRDNFATGIEHLWEKLPQR
ncbi:MAG TPA: hypothetical protein VF669_01545 [Tepidisphaeraceae bacterium]|jgi:hypothetical protein